MSSRATLPSPQTQTQGQLPRRAFLSAAGSGAVAAKLMLSSGSARAQGAAVTSLEPIKQIRAGVLDVGYYDVGPANGWPVILLHGWPYDIHSYVEVAPWLASRGCRVIVPHMRGHGTTRIVDSGTARSGQQAAIGSDVVALMDAMAIPSAVLAGYDWGGRAACVAAALWPQRCNGLVSVNSYLIQDIKKASLPSPARVEAAFWYQFYFLTERGKAGLTKNRREIARLMWERNSPSWHFEDTTFERSASAFDNPDYVDVTIHSYRHRLGAAAGYPEYARLEAQLAAQPVISVPTITMDGNADGVVPATDGTSTAAKFSGERQHRIIPGVGHNLPQEAPMPFAGAVLELAQTKR